MPKVTLDSRRHVIDYGDHDQSHLLRQYADATIETHDTLPNGIRRGNYLHTDNTVQSPRDGHQGSHEEEHWQEAEEWAKREQENVLRSRVLDLDDTAKTVGKLFGGILYSVLLAASNPSNRLNLARWGWLQGSMVEWKEFCLRVGYHEAFPFVIPRNTNTIQFAIAPLNNQGLEKFLDEDNIFIYNPTTRVVEQIRGSGITVPTDAPFTASEANHFMVRDILGYMQDTRVTEDVILQMDVTDSNGIRVADLVPRFSQTVFDYSVVTDRDHVYVGYTGYKYMKVKGLDFNDKFLGRVELHATDNTVVQLITESEEGSDSNTYTITFSRASQQEEEGEPDG